MEIQRDWSRIRNWWALETPDVPREYGPPASSIEVAQTEKRLNLLFPTDAMVAKETASMDAPKAMVAYFLPESLRNV